MSAPLNFQTLFELDTTPEGASRTWARLGDGLTSASPATNEKLDQKAYLDDDGGQTSEVTGFQLTYSFSGDRIPGNAAQDFIFSKVLDLGAARHTNFRATGADGTVILGEATIAQIQLPGGDANSPAAIGFEIHLNGKPAKTDPVAATALTAVVAAGVGVGNTKFTATPGAGNVLKYRLTAAAQTVKDRQYIAQATAYTSGGNIAATAGQYLNMYELDAYNHVVKFASALLASGDIAAA
jgi:hypothetical protein